MSKRTKNRTKKRAIDMARGHSVKSYQKSLHKYQVKGEEMLYPDELQKVAEQTYDMKKRFKKKQGKIK